MSRENVDLVVGLFEALNVRDFAKVMDTYADDVELTLQGAVATLAGPGASGKAAVGAWFGDWFRQFERDYRFEILETQDRGERVLIVAVHHARGRVSGAVVEMPAAWIYTLRGGRVVRCDGYTDVARAREAFAAT